MVAFLSSDAGQTWSHSPTVFHDPDGCRCFFETKVTPLGSGRLLAVAWTVTAGDYRDLDNHYALSDDGGRTWTRPVSTGIRGQTMTPVWLGGGRILVLYNRRYGRQGIVMQVVQLSEDGWILGPETMLWDAAGAPGELARGAGGIDIFSDFAFGLPSALPIGDARLLAVHWCRERVGEPREKSSERYGIRWTRLQLTE